MRSRFKMCWDRSSAARWLGNKALGRAGGPSSTLSLEEMLTLLTNVRREKTTRCFAGAESYREKKDCRWVLRISIPVFLEDVFGVLAFYL